MFYERENKNLLEELISQISSKEELEQLREQLFKREVENLLLAEMTAHLGHPKGMPPSGTNIRNGHSEKTLRTTPRKTTLHRATPAYKISERINKPERLSSELWWRPETHSGA